MKKEYVIRTVTVALLLMLSNLTATATESAVSTPDALDAGFVEPAMERVSLIDSTSVTDTASVIGKLAPGRLTCKSPSCAKAVTSPASWNLDAPPKKP